MAVGECFSSNKDCEVLGDFWKNCWHSSVQGVGARKSWANLRSRKSLKTWRKTQKSLTSFECHQSVPQGCMKCGNIHCIQTSRWTVSLTTNDWKIVQLKLIVCIQVFDQSGLGLSPAASHCLREGFKNDMAHYRETSSCLSTRSIPNFLVLASDSFVCRKGCDPMIENPEPYAKSQ